MAGTRDRGADVQTVMLAARQDLLVEIQTVYHVGTLELADRTGRSSLEGSLLSVSEHPEAWSRIAHSAGDTWILERDGATWLDALALTVEDHAAISAWAISEGLARRSDIWRAWRHDDEMGGWCTSDFDTEEEARCEIDDLDDSEPDDVPSGSGTLLDRLDGAVLTEAGMDAVGRWHDPVCSEDAIVILWADRVLKPETPDLVGVWWFEADDPDILSCPRGGAFPDRLSGFSIMSSRGEPAPASFTERHGIRADEFAPGL